MSCFSSKCCLISIQTCNKSLFAFLLSSFCLLVIVSWVYWYDWVDELCCIKICVTHTTRRATVVFRTEWQSDTTELSFAVAAVFFNPLWRRFLPVASMLFWRTSALLKAYRLKLRSYAFCYAHWRRKIFLYKVITALDLLATICPFSSVILTA